MGFLDELKKMTRPYDDDDEFFDDEDEAILLTVYRDKLNLYHQE